MLVWLDERDDGHAFRRCKHHLFAHRGVCEFTSERAYSPFNRAPAGTRGETDEWRAALRQKVSFVRRTITDLAARHPACPHDCAFLFSDLDVLPLRPYAELVRHLKRASLIFMREPQQSSAGYVNSGFYLLRPLPPVLTFLRDWANSFTADHYNDQHLANALLWKWDGNTSAPPVDARNVDFGHAFSRWGLRWKAFPASLVAGHADNLARGTVAFHGVFNVGVERKLQVLQKIALKARGWRRHVKLRTCVPPPSAEPSILPPGHACAAEPGAPPLRPRLLDLLALPEGLVPLLRSADGLRLRLRVRQP